MLIRIKSRLMKAKELLIKGGWAQGNFKNDKQQYCALGAIYSICGVCNDVLEIERMKRVFTQANSIDNITQWNDTPGRTKEEVLEAFDKAINLC